MRMQSNNFLHSVRIYTCKSLWARVFFSRVRLAASVSATGRSHASLTETAETAHEKSLAPRVIYSIYSIF